MAPSAELVAFVSDPFEPDEVEEEHWRAQQGKRAISRQLADPIQGRRDASKLFHRTTNIDNRGTLGTLKHRTRIFNIYKSWLLDCRALDTLHLTPEPKQYYQFACHYSNLLLPVVAGKPAAQKTTFLNALKALKSAFNFRYPDFKIDTYWGAKLDNLVDTLVKQGKILPGVWRKRQHVGFLLLRKIIMINVSSALIEGVRSWDVFICRWVSLLCQSSFNCRSGDITLSSDWTGDEFLAWKDIDARLGDGFDFADVQLKICLRFEKEMKEEHNNDRYVFISPLVDEANNFMCPVRLIFILAMRCGQTSGKTTAEVLALMRSNGGKLLWSRPDDPVFPAFEVPFKDRTTKKVNVYWQRPATCKQVNDTVKKFGQAANIKLPGVDNGLVSHDIRRGAAKDMKHLPIVKAGVSPAIAAAIGHKGQTQLAGVTDLYTGRESFNVYNDRAEHVKEDRFAPEFGVPMKRKSNPRGSVKALMESTPNLSRYKAGIQVRAQLSAEKEEQINKKRRLDGPIVPNQFDEADRIITAAVKNSNEDSPTPVIEPTHVDTHSLFITDDNIDPNIDPSLDSVADMSDDTADRLLGLIIYSDESKQQDDSGAVFDGSNDEDMDLLVDAAGSLELSLSPTATIPPSHAFIDHFAKVNVVCLAHGIQPSTAIDTGYSRDEPTAFLFKCKHQDSGCQYSSNLLANTEWHQELYCPYRSEESLEAMEAKKTIDDAKPILCACGKRYSRTGFPSHKKICQVYLASQADSVPECDDDESPSISASSSSWVPKKCDRGCTSDKIFEFERYYDQHVRVTHIAAEAYDPHACDHTSGCTSKTIFKTWPSFRQHLVKFHKMSAAEIKVMFPTRHGAKGKVRAATNAAKAAAKVTRVDDGDE